MRLGNPGREVVGLEDKRLLEEEANFEVVEIQLMPAMLGWLENGSTLRDNLDPEQEEELLRKSWSRQPSGIFESTFMEASTRYSDEFA